MNPTETRQLWQVVAAMGLLSTFVVLYVRGGRSNRAVRVWGGGLAWAIGNLLLALWSGIASVWMLLAIPAYPAALSAPYGGDNTTASKLRERAIFGIAVGASSGAFLIPLGLVWPWVYQVLLAMFTSVFYGVTNPTSAVGEEGIISLGMVFTVPFLLIR